MPLGIGGLTSLQTLSRAIIEGPDNGFNISELKELSDLQGLLSIEGLHNVRSVGQAKEAGLQQKKGLDAIWFKWGYDFDDTRNVATQYEVLRELRPHHMLRKLEISFYDGKEFPSWVGSPQFDQLTKLTLIDCGSCTHLPKLEHLQSLQTLYVRGLNKVLEFCAFANASNDILFPSLEVLMIYDMECLERWSTSGDGAATSFPRIRRVCIESCPKLAQVLVGLLPSLSHLYIKGCSEEVLRSLISVSMSIHTLKMKKIKGLIQLDVDVLKHLWAVGYVSIEGCDELTHVGESESEACKFLVSLGKLFVLRCRNLVSFGVSMESVRRVFIEECDKLENYNCPNSVEELEIENCGSMASVIFSPVPTSSLKRLWIFNCNNLRLFHEEDASLIPPAWRLLIVTA